MVDFLQVKVDKYGQAATMDYCFNVSLSIEREELLEMYRRLEHVFRVNMINN